MARFVLQLAFTRDNERRLQVRPAHRDYLTRLHEQGKLEMAGPWADDSGALIVYQVEDESEARAILARDPYTIADVVEVVRLTEWRTILP
jgi:uncharacterized protein YciI